MVEVKFTCEECGHINKTSFDCIYFYTEEEEYYPYDGNPPHVAKAEISCEECGRSKQLR